MADGHRRKALPLPGHGLNSSHRRNRTGDLPHNGMAYEFNGYGNVKVAGNSARALGLVTEHSLSYITGGSAGLPNGRPAATCC